MANPDDSTKPAQSAATQPGQTAATQPGQTATTQPGQTAQTAQTQTAKSASATQATHHPVVHLAPRMAGVISRLDQRRSWYGLSVGTRYIAGVPIQPTFAPAPAYKTAPGKRTQSERPAHTPTSGESGETLPRGIDWEMGPELSYALDYPWLPWLRLFRAWRVDTFRALEQIKEGRPIAQKIIDGITGKELKSRIDRKSLLEKYLAPWYQDLQKMNPPEDKKDQINGLALLLHDMCTDLLTIPVSYYGEFGEDYMGDLVDIPAIVDWSPEPFRIYFAYDGKSYKAVVPAAYQKAVDEYKAKGGLAGGVNAEWPRPVQSDLFSAWHHGMIRILEFISPKLTDFDQSGAPWAAAVRRRVDNFNTDLKDTDAKPEHRQYWKIPKLWVWLFESLDILSEFGKYGYGTAAPPKDRPLDEYVGDYIDWVVFLVETILPSLPSLTTTPVAV